VARISEDEDALVEGDDEVSPCKDMSVVPVWLRGLWRRRSIEWPDGRRDDTTIVYWLQTESAFADIRIPAERPNLRGRATLAELAPDERLALAAQAGFAGWTELSGDRCLWHRTIDYQPPSGVPDEGRLKREGGVLIEDGVHEPYVEVWEPVDCGSGPIRTVARSTSDGLRQLFVMHGDVFMLVRARRMELPQAASLAALLTAAASNACVELLDCEISLGWRSRGARPWEIRHSTLPFREGTSFDPSWLDR
jgi:hypothetical protein